MVVLLLIIYGVVAGASIAGFVIAAENLSLDGDNPAWILCGILWPIGLLPAVGYLVGIWWIVHRDEEE